jgi:hypothetical protein
MEEDWVMIYSSTVLVDVEMKRIYLEDNGISAIVLNKQDSVYNTFGAIELYVNRDHILKAKQLLQS